MALDSELQRLVEAHSWESTVSLRERFLFEVEGYSPPPTAYTEAQSTGLSSDAQSSWWYRTRNLVIHQAIRRYGNKDVLWDIGAGAGEVSAYLNGNGIATICVEPSSAGAAISASRGINSIIAELADLKLPDNCLGQLGMFDVVEHLTNRSEFLREVYRVMQPGGKIIVTVPALKFLWGQMDVQAGHFIRYSRRSIRRELRNAGFECTYVAYFFVTLVLPLLVLRAIPYRLGLKQPVSDGAMLKNDGRVLGKGLERFETVFSKFFPFGTSLLAVATKPN